MNHIINVFKGMCIGIADAIPGVSGGTIAVILKIYDQFLECLTLNLKKLFKNIKFILPVGIGILLGIVMASKVLAYLFEVHNSETQLFFLGVIIGSLPLIYKEGTSKGKFKPVHLIPFLLMSVGMIAFNAYAMDNAKTADTLHPVVIILITALAAAAMIMPGLSGALVLKVLGGYDLAIRSVNELDIVTLMFYAIGAVIGLLAAGKIISVLLKKCHYGTYSAILGLIVGSLPAIFPADYFSGFNASKLIGIGVFVIGLVLPMLTEIPEKLHNSRKNESSENTETTA